MIVCFFLPPDPLIGVSELAPSLLHVVQLEGHLPVLHSQPVLDLPALQLVAVLLPQFDRLLVPSVTAGEVPADAEEEEDDEDVDDVDVPGGAFGFGGQAVFGEVVAERGAVGGHFGEAVI